MTGIDLAEVRKAITRAFSADDFDMFLSDKFDFDRPANVADAPFNTVVFNVLKLAEKEGWDAALIAEVAKARPLKADVQEVYKKYAMGLVDESLRKQIDEGVLQNLERYGLVPPDIKVERAGATESVASATGTGLQKAVRQLNPTQEAGLWAEQFLRLQGRVGRVEAALGGGQYEMGTAFLVGPGIILTNYHVLKRVIETPKLAPGVQIRFDYRVLAGGTESQGELISLRDSDWLVDWSPYTQEEAAGNPDAKLPTEDELDHALVRLSRPVGDEPRTSGQPEGPRRGWIAIPEAPQPLVLGMGLMILHHPLTRPLKLSPDTQAVLSINGNGTRVRYANNTEAGSSGSPVFDVNWNLVALHHYGDPAFNQRPNWNQGIPIGKIRERLRRQGLEKELAGPCPYDQR